MSPADPSRTAASPTDPSPTPASEEPVALARPSSDARGRPGAVGAVARWWCRPVPAARVAYLRVLVYLFLWLDLLDFTGDVVAHGYGAGGLYRPVLVARLLHLPAPGPLTVRVLQVVILAGALVAATGWRPRITGGVVAVAYTWWQLVNMSYGKVDHDHFALLVAVWVLPTAGVAAFRDRTPTERAGFAVRAITVAVVMTYALAAGAKLRVGGLDWATGATFTWAVFRRGSVYARLLLDHPLLLVAGQFGLLAAESLSVFMLWLRRWPLYAYVAFWAFFHLTTYLAIGIHFLPTAVLLAAFLPLERLTPAAQWLGARVRARSSPRSS